MKASKLIAELAECINAYGDLEVRISILSDNNDNFLKINHVEEYLENNKCNYIDIIHEVDNIKELKKKLK